MQLRSFNETLDRELQDPIVAVAYLEDAMEESAAEFLVALRKYVRAHGGMAAIAQKAGVPREALYRMLSENGNPNLSSLDAVLRACGLKVKFEFAREPVAA